MSECTDTKCKLYNIDYDANCKAFTDTENCNKVVIKPDETWKIEAFNIMEKLSIEGADEWDLGMAIEYAREELGKLND